MAGEASETPGTMPGRARDWRTWLLVGSLALNLFFVAMAVGALMSGHRGGMHGGVRDVGFGPFTEALTGADRKALRDAFVAARPDFRDGRREAREDFAAFVAALRKDPWDPALADAALARQGKRTAERLEVGRTLFLDRLTAMTPAERAALADRIEDMARRRGAPRKD